MDTFVPIADVTEYGFKPNSVYVTIVNYRKANENKNPSWVKIVDGNKIHVNAIHLMNVGNTYYVHRSEIARMVGEMNEYHDMSNSDIARLAMVKLFKDEDYSDSKTYDRIYRRVYMRIGSKALYRRRDFDVLTPPPHLEETYNAIKSVYKEVTGNV
jgi:hypothetical protein